MPAGDVYTCSGSPLTWGSTPAITHIPWPTGAGYPHWSGSAWTYDTPGSSLPTGLVAMILSGTCPSGWSEVAALNGKMIRGTLAANGDVGTTGGSATITPSGTVSTPTLTMNSYTPAGSVTAPTFTGTANQTTSATSAGTPAGTNAATATSGNCAATNIAAGTGSTTACKATAPNLTVPAETFTGSAMATHTHTLTPAGTNSAPTFSGTPATLSGSVSQPTFTGTAVDPSPAYVKAIFCSKN